MEGAICIGKVSSVGKFRVCVDQEHNERMEDGTTLYEHYVFDRWAFWNDVSVGDWCKVSVSHHGRKVITTVEKIEEPAAEGCIKPAHSEIKGDSCKSYYGL